MVQLTTEQGVFIVLHYTQNQNTTAMKNTFGARFPDRNPKIIVPIAYKIFKSSQIPGAKRLFYRKTSTHS